MKISICIPSSGKRPEMLDKAIQSVLSQSHQNVEVIVKNNGPASVPIHNGRIKYIMVPDTGIFDGANQAMAHATGDILCFMGDDDMLAPEALRLVNDVFEGYGNKAGWLYGAVEYIDQQGKLIGTRVANGLFTLQQMRESNCLATPAIFWNQAMRKVAGDFRTEFAVADYDLWLRFWGTCEPMICTSTLGYYRQWIGSYSSNTVARTEADAADVRKGTQRQEVKKIAPKIPLNVCTYEEEEIQAAIDVLRSTNVTMGEQCRAFEIEFANKVGVKEAVFVNSGSSANLLAWFALANPQFNTLPVGWEVIVPAVGWATTYWPIVQAGGKPVIVDCDPKTLQMNIEAMRRALTPRTVAICPVHVLGNAVDMNQVMEFAKTHNLIVIEDTCEALGTRFGNQFVGTFGKAGTYSFFFSHHITSIEGGMIATNDSKYADVLRMMRSHGWSRASSRREFYESQAPAIDPRFFFATTGFNLRSTEINAVIGRIQLTKLNRFNGRRNMIARVWNDRFANNRFFKPMQITPGTDPAWFGYPIMCIDTITRNNLKAHLESAGIETRPIVSGNIRRHPAMAWLSYRVSGTLEGADAVTDQGLLWGLHPNMTHDEVGYVMGVVEAFRV